MSTEDITQITKELERYEIALFETSVEYRKLAEDAGRKRAIYDVAWAQELLKIKSNTDLKATVPEREAMATIAVQTFMTETRIAEAVADASKRHLQTLQAILSSVQTRSKLLYSEWMSGSRQA